MLSGRRNPSERTIPKTLSGNDGNMGLRQRPQDVIFIINSEKEEMEE